MKEQETELRNVDIRLHLAVPSLCEEQAVAEMMAAWHQAGGRINPYLLRRYDGDYRRWLQLLHAASQEAQPDHAVPQTLWLLEDPSGSVFGAVAIRHYLNETNLLDGGHIAYGIAPAFRGQGLGTAALRLALHQAGQMGIRRALITCDEDNLASRRVIERCGGVLENQTEDEDGVPIRRYWADCTE